MASVLRDMKRLEAYESVGCPPGALRRWDEERSVYYYEKKQTGERMEVERSRPSAADNGHSHTGANTTSTAATTMTTGTTTTTATPIQAWNNGAMKSSWQPQVEGASSGENAMEWKSTANHLEDRSERRPRKRKKAVRRGSGSRKGARRRFYLLLALCIRFMQRPHHASLAKWPPSSTDGSKPPRARERRKRNRI